ncbi:MAG: MHS family MFS transporter [Thermogemmatispora sp.]|uniref:MFS transporter n=1 Tax=Thermogemmatispora TaxID=768669 RepID=UPI00124BECA2|nr:MULTISPECIES: MFS transporter [Thermogemmatispora]MBE3565825.1 MHS family MFS transporter [Thermogemmatispora sp.]GER84287.1 MFS transporter [Thermogemmatispora aurantia]
MATVSETSPVTVRRMVPILAASTVGTAIEWYDFFLYGFLSATVFPRFFFPELNPVAGTIASFTTNFVGFFARPLGGAFFGWFGDRVGRKSTLIATLLLMGIATALMGLLPGYDQIGLAAPLVLSVLRFLQGAGVGGEWGGSVLLSMEYGDNRRRGFWMSWPQTGVPLGLALAAIAVLSFQAIFPGEAFLSIGWRIPFLLSLLLILVGLYIRLRILETPAFRRVKETGRIAHVPLVEVFRHYWREIILSALVRSAEQAPFYLFTTFILSYGSKTLKVDSNVLYAGLIISAVCSLILMPTWSHLSDRFGRKRWYMIGCVLMALYAFPYFLLLETRQPVVVLLAMILSISFCHDWLYGPQAALISERFGTRLRYSGASLGYQLASITAGGPAPILATWLLANTHTWLGNGTPSYTLIAVFIIFMAVVSFISTALIGRELAGQAAVEDVGGEEARLATQVQ